MQKKSEEQIGSAEDIQQELNAVKQEKAALESHSDVLEKALMKLSKDQSTAGQQVRICRHSSSALLQCRPTFLRYASLHKVYLSQ